MNNVHLFTNHMDIFSGKLELPSREEIEAIERRCEFEHDDAIWSVIAAPFKALKSLLDYSGQVNQGVAGTV